MIEWIQESIVAKLRLVSVLVCINMTVYTIETYMAILPIERAEEIICLF